MRTQQNFMGMTMQSNQPCPKCGGTGTIITDPCTACRGKGKVRYQIPEGTQTGTTFRLRGKGIPYVGYKTRGDQFVTVVVETPTKLTREQKELLKQLESSVGDDGQPKRKSFFDKLKG